MKEGASLDTPASWPKTRDEEVGEVAFTEGTQNLISAQDQLQRGLKSRHIQFLALGGA